MSTPHLPRTGRRAVLGVGLAGLLVGCTGDPTPSDAPSAAPGAIAPTEPAVDADTTLARAVVHEIIVTAAVVRVANRLVPSLRPALAPLRRMHAAHLDAIDDLGGGQSFWDPSVPRNPARALAEVRRVEARLQARLSRSALDAESGSLARLLASMAASVAQHRAVLG